MENRQGMRCRTFALAEIKNRGGERSMGLIYNISRDGMFVLNGAGFDVDRYVNICMPQITHEDEPVQVSGLVIHRSSTGFGLMFGRIDKSARQLVANLVDRRGSWPAEIHEAQTV